MRGGVGSGERGGEGINVGRGFGGDGFPDV